MRQERRDLDPRLIVLFSSCFLFPCLPPLFFFFCFFLQSHSLDRTAYPLLFVLLWRRQKETRMLDRPASRAATSTALKVDEHFLA